MDHCDHNVPVETRDAPLPPVKDVLRKTPNMSGPCMRVFLDIDEMIDVTCKDHARRYPYDPLVGVIQQRRWTADKPGAVDLVAMHIDWRSDCRHMIAHTTLHHCHRMLSRYRIGAGCRAVLSAHVSKEDGATKAWLQLYLEPVGESHDTTPPPSDMLVDDAMACETLPLREPLPRDPVPSSPPLAAPPADAGSPRKVTNRETPHQGVLKVLGLYPNLPAESRKMIAALVRSIGHLACEWVANVGTSPVSTITVTAPADIALAAQRIKSIACVHGRIHISASCQPSGEVVLAIVPARDETSPKGGSEGASQATTTPTHFILPKPEPAGADETNAKANPPGPHAPPTQPASRGDDTSEAVERAPPCAAAPPAQTPVDIITLYPTMTIQEAGYVFAAENQLVGVAHHWVTLTTLLAMRAKTVSVSLRAAPAAMARAVSEHTGLRGGTKKVVLALCKDTVETSRLLCAIVDVLPGPERQSPIQVAALYPHLTLCDAIVVGALEARLCTLPHVWVARWPNSFPSQRTRLTPDMDQAMGIADLLCGGMVGHENAWLVLALERTDDDGGGLWLSYGRASSQTKSA
ncbi:hypothetical protein pmac_cds_830 [Pandoravirus macleodensis]|uniref:DUF5860 domain-containing protein n=1 Tax=Pandoravirus macleodensis TaxID=2107707 RepID=A0A2U7UG86_9VIRU|nr:hypothetical protein pmac_cds_830 [Pandoravirus macleodensis]AVK77518.1 hypothetical protein pmac_cds_830 [Pandoravirus macleodensis]UMO80323.1 hypothetical protein [Pandoravirus aubagnensis]